MMIDRLEPRQLYASITGYVFNDNDSSLLFDNQDSARAGATVFIDANKNGTLDSGEQSTTANSKGVYSFTGLAAGDYTIGTDVDKALYHSTTATKYGTTQGLYNIEFRGLDDASAIVKNAFISAAQKWESIIVGDDTDVPQRDGSKIDDLVIDVRFGPIDGPGSILAYAQPTGVRVDDKSYHAYRGEMRFDSADASELRSEQSLNDVVLHEMGHVLGIGTNWRALGLVTGGNSRSPRFIGENAVREYNRLFKTVNVSVPLENSGSRGTREAHWSENALHEELMTGYLDAAQPDDNGDLLTPDIPLSAITVGALDDEGYEVDYANADDWNPRTHDVTFADQKDDYAGIVYERTISVDADDAITGYDFGYRLSQKPIIKSLTVSPSTNIPVDRDIVISAAGVTDPDGDQISGVTFYRESNGIDGLQKGEDTLIGYRRSSKAGVWKIQTNTAGLSGETKYYVLATDDGGTSGRRTATINVVTSQTPQTEPDQLSVRQRNSNTVRFAFNYTEGNALGFRVQVATNRAFDGPSLVQAFNIDPDTTNLDITNLRAGVRYYVRVRAYNEAGVGGYSQPLSFELA